MSLVVVSTESNSAFRWYVWCIESFRRRFCTEKTTVNIETDPKTCLPLQSFLWKINYFLILQAWPDRWQLHTLPEATPLRVIWAGRGPNKLHWKVLVVVLSHGFLCVITTLHIHSPFSTTYFSQGHPEECHLKVRRHLFLPKGTARKEEAWRLCQRISAGVIPLPNTS